MPESAISGRIDELIQEVGLEVKRDAMIKGLSRGMKQRLGIARAVIHKPKVLLLDEPASGLDPKARMDLRNLLLSLRDQGATILISSHILTELEGFCTSIGLMEKGRMVRSGSIAEITAAESRYRVIRLSWTGSNAAQVEQTLQGHPKISQVLIQGSQGVFQFSGGEEELPAVLAALVAAGVPLLSFAEVKQTVEDIYLKLSRNEVM
jgi:ABC-2 type transport system ATP-binding protein